MKKIEEIKLEELVERKVEKRRYFDKTLSIITHYLNPELLKSAFGKEVSHIRRTILFAKTENGAKDHFCDIDIINIHEKYLVTYCEHMNIKMELRKGEKLSYFENLLASGNLKCFVVSKDDMYIGNLLQHMKLVAQGAICKLLDYKIDSIFNNSTVNAPKIVTISKSFVLKQLVNLLKKKTIDTNVLCWRSYMSNIVPKSIKNQNNVLNITYIYDSNVIPNNDSYKKEIIFEEGIGVFTIQKEIPGKIFENTPIANIISKNETLTKGTQIFVKNNDYNVTVYLESIDDAFDIKMTTGFKVTTDIKVIVYRPIGTACDIFPHFIEGNVKISVYQLYEIFKKVLREKFSEDDLLNVS